MQKVCPRCQTATDIQTAVCFRCGHQFRTQFTPPIDQTQVVPAAWPTPAQVSPHSRRDLPQFALGIGGAILLAFGVFSPLVSLPLVGNLNMFLNGTESGWILLVLALAGLLSSAFRYWPAASIFGGCACLFIAFKAGSVFQLASQQEAAIAQIQWGWLLLSAGAISLLLCGILTLENRGMAAAIVLLIILLSSLLGVYSYQTDAPRAKPQQPENAPAASLPLPPGMEGTTPYGATPAQRARGRISPGDPGFTTPQQTLPGSPYRVAPGNDNRGAFDL